MDGLLKWTNRDDAIECGQALGATVIDPETGEVKTTVRLETPFGFVNLSLIGQHRYISDNSDPENLVTTTVPGWWYLFRAPNGFPLDVMLGTMTKPPAVPWHSEMVDENGDPVPRPPKEIAPTRVWV